MNPIKRGGGEGTGAGSQGVAVGGDAPPGRSDAGSSPATSVDAAESSNEDEQRIRARAGNEPVGEIDSKRVAEDNAGGAGAAGKRARYRRREGPLTAAHPRPRRHRDNAQA